MNVTFEGSGALSPMDLSLLRSKGIVIGFWTVTALFCLPLCQRALRAAERDVRPPLKPSSTRAPAKPARPAARPW